MHILMFFYSFIIILDSYKFNLILLEALGLMTIGESPDTYFTPLTEQNSFLYQCIIFFPEIFFFVTIVFILFYFLYTKDDLYLRTRKIFISIVYLFFLLLEFYYFEYQISFFNSYKDFMGIFSETYFFGALIYSHNTVCIKFFLFLFLIIFLPLFAFFLRSFRSIPCEIQIFFLLLVFTIVLLVHVYNLFILYLLLEMLNFILCFFFAFTYDMRKMYSEAVLKYFMFNSLSSVLILMGITIIYSIYQTVSYDVLAVLSTEGVSQGALSIEFTYFGLFFIILGFLMKIGTFPLSLWLIDVYEQTPLFFLFFLIIIVKSLYFYLFITFLYVFIAFKFFYIPFIIALGVISILFSSFLIVNQRIFRRFIGYTSLNQSGFILLNISELETSRLCDVDLLTFNVYNVEAGGFFWYIFIYCISSFILFTILFSLNYLYDVKIVYLNDLQRLITSNQFYLVCYSIVILSFSGIPPLAGFLVKIFAVFNLFKAGYLFSVFIILVSSIISAYYYFKLIKILFFFNKDSTHFYIAQRKKQFNFIISMYTYQLLFILNFLLIFFPLGFFIEFYDYVSTEIGIFFYPHLDYDYLFTQREEYEYFTIYMGIVV